MTELYDFCPLGIFHHIGIRSVVAGSAIPLTQVLSAHFGIPTIPSFMTSWSFQFIIHKYILISKDFSPICKAWWRLLKTDPYWVSANASSIFTQIFMRNGFCWKGLMINRLRAICKLSVSLIQMTLSANFVLSKVRLQFPTAEGPCEECFIYICQYFWQLWIASANCAQSCQHWRYCGEQLGRNRNWSRKYIYYFHSVLRYD